MPCEFCGVALSAERAEVYRHCTNQTCVNTWRQRRIADSGLALVNVHKQGPMWVKRSEVPANSMRRDGGLR